ncbi:uncharacterized protein LOC128206137 [Mya arenaria]|uniref:uncharacterized protein LOC128206137 n=1 Tax=Mya arenaria TaxID=6604 RepID=UPI0022E71F53|nr:uncharacterized protein LOC128206137 [Mya arenaria]
MQVNILFQVFGIILCSSCLVKGGFYADKVRDLFERHFTNKDNECWETTGADKTTDDKGMAKALVNVYTQDCLVYNHQQGHTFTVDAFWSTSLLREEANEFLTKDSLSIFFEIHTTCGADISSYSEFQTEKEILLQSNRTFYVTEYVADEAGIKTKKEGVKGEFEWEPMKAFAVVTGIIPASSSKSGYCDCSDGAPSYGTSRSAASMPTSFLSAVIFVAFRLVY